MQPSLQKHPLYRPKYLMEESHYLRFLEICQHCAPFSWFHPGDTKYWDEGLSFAFYMQDGDNIHHNFKGPGILTFNHDDYGYCYELYEILSQYLSKEELMNPMFVYFEKDDSAPVEIQEEDDEEITISVRQED